MTDHTDAELEALFDWVAFNLKDADRSDEEIEAVAAERAQGDAEAEKEHCKHLRNMRRMARRTLLDRGADAMLHNRPIEDYRVRYWLFEFLNTEAKKLHDKRTETDSTRDFHMAKWVKQRNLDGQNETEAIAAIAEANNLSESRVKDIYQKYRHPARSHWEQREKMVIANIENLIDEGWNEAAAIVEIIRVNELTEKRVRQIWQDHQDYRAQKTDD